MNESTSIITESFIFLDSPSQQKSNVHKTDGSGNGAFEYALLLKKQVMIQDKNEEQTGMNYPYLS